MFTRRKRVRLALRMAALTVFAVALALPATSMSAGASTITQDNGCFGNATSIFSQSAVPITGTATPNPATLPDRIRLTGVSVAISVDAALIAAAVADGDVSAAPDLANIGWEKISNPPNGLTIPDGNAGISAVTASVGGVSLRIGATNTVEGTQTATNMADISVPFYVTADKNDGSNIVVYTSVTNGFPNQPGADPTRTGTPLVGNLVVPIPLTGHKVGTTNTAGDTIWSPRSAGAVDFSELSIWPPSNTAPSPSSQDLAPLRIVTKINNLPTSSSCWPGTVDDTTDPPTFVPGPSITIDSVTVNEPTTSTGEPTTTGQPPTITTGPGPITTSTVPPTTITTVGPSTTTTEEPSTTTTGPGPTTTTTVCKIVGGPNPRCAGRPTTTVATTTVPGSTTTTVCTKPHGTCPPNATLISSLRSDHTAPPRALLLGVAMFLFAFSFFGVRRIPRRA